MSDTDSACRGAIDNTDDGSLSALEISKNEMDESSQAAVKDSIDFPPSTMDDTNQKQSVILVVANSRNDTVGIVDSLKRSLKRDGDWGHDETAAGVHIHACQSVLIVDTIPLHYKRGGNRRHSDIARRWISRNGLRRILLGKDVFVVCVVLSRLVYTRKSMFEAEPEMWMEVFGLIFKPLDRAVIILAKVEANTSTSEVELFVKKHGLLQQNIIYSNGDTGDMQVGNLIEESIRSPTNATVVSFLMLEDQLEKLGVWVPERVILFGRTGSGKSTLAHMLTKGELYPKSKTLEPSPGAGRGSGKSTLAHLLTKGELDPKCKTLEPSPRTGRGWYVLDTPNFGESKDPSISISTLGKRIAKNAEGTFSHYLYVVKMGRLDRLDKKLWDFYSSLFGEEIKQQFSVVVSNAHDDWIEENRSALKEHFDGCNNIFSANFPTTPHLPEEELIHLNQEDCNNIYQERRREALRTLEERLAKLGLIDMHSRFVKTSKLTELLKTDDYATLLPVL